MSMLTTHFSNLYMTPAIVKKLLGFKVNPVEPSSVIGPSSSVANTNSSSQSPLTANISSTLNGGDIKLNSLNNSNQSMSNHNKMCEKAIRTLVKKLKKMPGALEELERAVTTRDPNTKCIIYPTKSNPQNPQVSRKTSPHFVYCRIWRWSDLQNCNELKPHCQQGYHHLSNGGSKKDVCINPYHYARCEAPPHYSQTNQSNASPLTVYVPKPSNSLTDCAGTNGQQTNKNFASSSILPLSDNTTASSSSSSSSTSSPSVLPQNGGGEINQQQQQSMPTTGDLIHGNNYMVSPSPVSVKSPSSIGSNPISNQFSPFISEDDSSEINDISPSPLGPMDLMPVTMVEQPYWCSLSYYEMKQRVGEMFHVGSHVNSVTIDGYTDPSSGDRFCLGILSNINRTSEIEMTRHYIGKGLMLSYENGQVFAECLSDNPVFVQSPNCNQRYNWHLATVVKIPPGCNLKIFDEADFVQVANETVYQGYEAVYALTRICTIRISFVKGWGAEYRRQTILNTPCWIEVHLNNPLKLVDQILTKMGSPRTKCTSFS